MTISVFFGLCLAAILVTGWLFFSDWKREFRYEGESWFAWRRRLWRQKRSFRKTLARIDANKRRPM